MRTNVGNNFIIDISQAPEKGTPWQVRVYRKILGFKQRISSDWFLDEEQAKAFAEQLARDLNTNGSTASLKQRKPGWTLHT